MFAVTICGSNCWRTNAVIRKIAPAFLTQILQWQAADIIQVNQVKSNLNLSIHRIITHI